MKAFILEHPVNQLAEKYFKHLKTNTFMNEGCLFATANPQIFVGALLKIESKGFIFCWYL